VDGVTLRRRGRTETDGSFWAKAIVSSKGLEAARGDGSAAYAAISLAAAVAVRARGGEDSRDRGGGSEVAHADGARKLRRRRTQGTSAGAGASGCFKASLQRGQ